MLYFQVASYNNYFFKFCGEILLFQVHALNHNTRYVLKKDFILTNLKIFAINNQPINKFLYLC